MNLFVVPSWYPSAVSSISGIFLKEQACSIGELRPKWNVVISLWGQGQYLISVRQPVRISQVAINYWRNRNKHSVITLEENVQEYRTLAIHWTPRIYQGNLKGLLHANEINFLRAMKQFEHIDIIHAHVSYPAGWIAMKLSEKYKIPYLITEHMGPFPFKHLLKDNGDLKDIIRKPLENADAVIAVSPSLADRIHTFGLVKPMYIPNVINEQFFKPLSGEQHKGEKDKFSFFTLGGMTPQKGIPDLLASIQLFIYKLPQDEKNRVEFIIGGSGEEAKKYQLLADQTGVSQWIRWLGRISREEARCHFQHCDCFVLASHHETFGVVFAEAIACGKPLIATRCGGPECIVTEKNGILVEVSNPTQLSEALMQMYKSARDYNLDVIREGFLKRFSRSAVVDQLDEIYCRVLKERNHLCVE